MISLTVDDLVKICPRLKRAQAASLLPNLMSACAEFHIDSPKRLAAFLAQTLHETGGYRFFTEIWGPTKQQKRYEPPSSLADDLGNTQPGDGERFRGRGAIMITGRYNFEKYGKRLGVDLIGDPALAARPDIGFRIAGLYWQDHGLNKKADDGDFVGISKSVNGGLTGQASREQYWARAKEVLGLAQPVGP